VKYLASVGLRLKIKNAVKVKEHFETVDVMLASPLKYLRYTQNIFLDGCIALILRHKYRMRSLTNSKQYTKRRYGKSLSLALIVTSKL
jgi:hypothetical protein